MKKQKQYILFLPLLIAVSFLVQTAKAQNYVGVLGTVSDYRKVEVTGREGRSGNVGFGFGGGGGFVLGQTMGRNGRWGGELRYIYSRNDLELDAGADSFDLGGQSHVVHYDVLYYLKNREADVQPFVAVGFGVTVFQGTGDEVPAAPGSDLALLTKSSESMPTGDVGVGVRFRIRDNMFFRVEFRDYITSVPQKVISPAPGADIDGILNRWTGLFGLTWTF